ncbi:hypothetical protein R3P38DRAFT_3215571 [Favolaschia claudopus]|uniref:F-box domain-containing protein n=1 Tax=Favolaschia claudopus TaxID=2862362 RepID=A0AAW0A962_9AGAR
MPALAQELVDEITRLVDGTQNVKALSLASRAFRSSSQRRLFRTWLLYDRDARLLNFQRFKGNGPLVAATFKKARKIAADFPHLLDHARDLTVDLLQDARLELLEDVLLPQTPPLVRLAIRNQFSIHMVNMRDLNLTTSPLAHVFFLPTLRSFSLENFTGVPRSFIPFAMSRFDEVSFVELGIERTPETSPLPLHPIKARTLNLRCKLGILHDRDRFTTILDIDLQNHLRGLRTLKLSSENANWTTLLKEGDITQTLEHLEIKVTYLPRFPECSFTALRILRLDFQIHTKVLSGSFEGTALPMFPSSVSSFEHLMGLLPVLTPALESLTLYISVNLIVGPDSWPGPGENVEPFLGFVSMQHFPRLHGIHLAIASAEEASGFEEYAERLFPGPYAAQILSYSTFAFSLF